MDNSVDWQTSCQEIRHRGEYLLKTGLWSDCHFLVGTETNQQLLSGHKLILAMASPVFDAMFNGPLPEKNDPIPILDVQPEAFMALMEYIYTDKININSMDKACELCYVAKKYMLPTVVQKCTQFLWSDLNAKNVCRAFEFAKLFEETGLAERCLQMICTETKDVIAQPSFEDIELSTLTTILSQDCLDIDSELDLFSAMYRYAQKHDFVKDTTKEEIEEVDIESDAAAGPSSCQVQPESSQNEGQLLEFQKAVKKIRFLTMTPKEFAENVPRTNLLSTDEAFAILMNISSSGVHQMPDGFTVCRKLRRAGSISNSSTTAVNNVEYFNSFDSGNFLSNTSLPSSSGNFHIRSRAHRSRCREPQPLPIRDVMMNEVTDSRRFYCVRTIREQIDYFNTSVSDCALTFTVDRDISITGIQVSTQVLGEQSMQSGNLPERYSELLYAHLLDSYGTRLTYTHCTSNVRFDSLLEISFDHPVQIQRNRFYKIGVAFNKVGWYPMCICVPSITCEGVCFDFRIDGPHGESVRDGLIRAIVFTYPQKNDRDSVYSN